MRSSNHRRRRTLIALGLAVVLTACEDAAPRRAESIGLSIIPSQLLVGQSFEVTATCYDKNNSPIPNHPVSWMAPEPQIAVVRPSGSMAIVYAMHPAAYGWLVAACSREPLNYFQLYGDGPGFWPATVVSRHFSVVAASPASWDIDTDEDTVVLRAPTPEDSTSGTSRLITARGLWSDGNVVPPSTFTFSVSDVNVATVSSSGLIRAQSVGETYINVLHGSHVRTRPLSVRASPEIAPWDVALVDAHWTQGPQSLDQSIPILRESRAAVVNVLAAATADSVATSVELVVFDAAASAVFTDTLPLSLSADSAPTFARPNAQFLVPRAVIALAAGWQLRLIGGGVDVDAAPSNNALPRTGITQLRTHTPPVLKLHLVPIALSAHDNAMTTLLPSHVVYYDSIARLRLPIGKVEVTIGTPIVSSAQFFDSAGVTTGGGNQFFGDVLAEIDAARVKSSIADRIWIGVLPKPANATSSKWGGMAYFGTNPNEHGPMMRSHVTLGHDWYPTAPFNPSAIVAHELGHNFARRHAPCGGPAGPDPHYPVANGGVGEWVTWTTAFETGVNPTAEVFAPSTGDLMGYCNPRWIGPYTYNGILRFRALEAAALTAPRVREPILAVRGWLHETEVRVSRAEYTDGERIAEPGSSPVTVLVVANDGSELARHHALIGAVGDAEIGRPFTAHIPMDATTRRRATHILVRAGGLERRVPVPAAAP